MRVLGAGRNILSAVAGFTSDANSLVSYSRNAAQVSLWCTMRCCLRRERFVMGVLDADARSLGAQGHLSSYNEDMPVEQLVQKVCDLKQGYTQFGGTHPTTLAPPLLASAHPCAFQRQVSGRSVSRSSSPVMTLTTPSSSTRRTPPGTTRGGRRPASAPTTRRRRASSDRTSATTWGSTKQWGSRSRS